MIAFIKGKINSKSDDRVVVEAGGFGVEVHVTPSTAQGLKLGEEGVLFTYLRMWDTGIELYGFGTAQEKEFFELLISVNGVGAKVGLNIMAVAPLSNLARGIADGDERLVSQANKVGKKMAQKVILELKDKAGGYSSGSAQGYENSQSVIEALVALGYTRAQAREAVALVDDSEAAVAEQIKAALQILAK